METHTQWYEFRCTDGSATSGASPQPTNRQLRYVQPGTTESRRQSTALPRFVSNVPSLFHLHTTVYNIHTLYTGFVSLVYYIPVKPKIVWPYGEYHFEIGTRVCGGLLYCPALHYTTLLLRTCIGCTIEIFGYKIRVRKCSLTCSVSWLLMISGAANHHRAVAFSPYFCMSIAVDPISRLNLSSST